MNLLAYRRALMGGGGGAPSGRIPAEYQEVEWVGTNGTKVSSLVCINTGVVPKDQNHRLVTTMQIPSSTGTMGHWGLRTSASTNPNWISYQTGGRHYYKYASGATTGIGTYNTESWYEVDFGKNLVVNGSTITTKTNASISENTYNLYLFWYNGNNNSVNARLKETLIYDGNGDLIRDYVPCYRKSDERRGFYDLVNNNFVYNTDGAVTDLAKGADVT